MLTHCLLCGAEAAITVRVEDFDTLACPECNEEFDLALVEERMGQMAALVRACKSAQAAMAEAESPATLSIA
jgi:uncharacterized protein YbaR (Trm112 family)